MRLSRSHRNWVYGSSTLLMLSGAAWLVFHFLLNRQGELGDMPHPLEPWALRVHGAAAMLVLVVLGSLMPVHVRRGWHQRRNLRAGILLSAAALLLIVSGYALYYFGGEEARPWISALHWVIGLAALPLLVWHIVRGRSTVHAHQSQSPMVRSVGTALAQPDAGAPAYKRYKPET